MSTARYIEAAGTRVHLQEWTTDDGDGGASGRHAPTLLCLHGLGGGTHFFSALGPALARVYRCRTIAIDFPGSGLSPLPAREPAHGSSLDLFALFAEIVVDLVRREAIAKPYLLAHSMGTIVALDAIRQAPAIAGGLIVVGGLTAPLPDARTRILARAEEIRRSGTIGVDVGERVVAANFAQRTQGERPELTGLFAHLFARQHAASYAATAEALARATARPVPAAALAHLPCLVVSGEEDRYAPPDAIREFARALPAGTRVEIMRECGHLPFLEQPAAFAALVGRFLTS